jgi:hypothetical protein
MTRESLQIKMRWRNDLGRDPGTWGYGDTATLLPRWLSKRWDEPWISGRFLVNGRRNGWNACARSPGMDVKPEVDREAGVWPARGDSTF